MTIGCPTRGESPSCIGANTGTNAASVSRSDVGVGSTDDGLGVAMGEADGEEVGGRGGRRGPVEEVSKNSILGSSCEISEDDEDEDVVDR